MVVVGVLVGVEVERLRVKFRVRVRPLESRATESRSLDPGPD
jgi:hypothetical protein